MKKAIAVVVCAMLFAGALALFPAESRALDAPDAAISASPGAGISGFTITAGTLDRKFSVKRRAYKLTLGEAEAAVTVTPVKTSPAAAVTINGKAAENITLTLANGAKKLVKVKVALKGKKSREYTIEVVRKKSTDNKLAKLSVSSGVTDAAFDPAKTEYSASLDIYTPSVTITAEKSNPLAVLNIDGRRLVKKTYTLAPGGKKTVKLTVRSQSGKTKSYKIQITRASSAITGKAAALIDFARHYLGKPYKRGAKGPEAFDCSGFVYYCLKGMGTQLKYMTSKAWPKSAYATVATVAEMAPGDILCFQGHVGIYLGENMMIDAVPSAGGVRIASCATDHWMKIFVCGKRVYAADKPVEPENPPAPENPVQPENPPAPENPVNPENPPAPESPVNPEDPANPAVQNMG